MRRTEGFACQTESKIMHSFESSNRSLALGRNGMAATSHPLATLTALEILKAGGNAMDAAIAACAVQCVVEPGSTGIGGDCFALYSAKGSTDVVAYNGSGRTPKALSFEEVAVPGKTILERSSPHAVTIPGAIDAWTTLHRDHGRMPLAEVLQPAVTIAREGYVITPRVAYDSAQQTDLLRQDENAARTFLVDGNAPKVGDVMSQPLLADTLEDIGRNGRDAFYSGWRAQEMVDYLKARGGFHTLEDFASAAGEYVTPVTTEFRGRTVYECPPNGQGLIALMILNILSRFTPNGDPLSPDNLHREIEATRLAYAARDRYLADPALADVPVDYLLSDELADELASKIDLSSACVVDNVLPHTAHRDTVYIAVVDKDRNAVSFINSIFHSYGSGLLTPKAGILLHNRGESFSLKAGHPNAIGPGKRPMHTIIPGMVAEAGRVVMPFGVMGGHYQAMGHAHFLSKIFDHGLDPQAAIGVPRLFPFPGTAKVEAEAEIMAGPAEALRQRGFDVVSTTTGIGGAQAIWIDWDGGVLKGGSEPRKDGFALGY